MKIIQIIAILSALAFSTTKAELVSIEFDCLTVTVSDPGDEYPFVVNGTTFRTGTEAADALRFVYSNWPDDKPPTLVYDYGTMLDPKGCDDLDKAVRELSKKNNVRVIMMPPARNSLPESWLTAAKLIHKHAEQPGAAQPATKTADKVPAKVQSPTPTSKNGPSVVKTANLESIVYAYAHWLSLTTNEVQWLSKVDVLIPSLLRRINPDQAIALATDKVAELYKQKLYSVECQVVFFRGGMSGKDIELYQVKVFFYLADEGIGSPLCESVFVRSDGQLMFQRRE